MAKERLPFELAKPDSNTYVTQADQIGYEGKALSDKLAEIDTLNDNITELNGNVEELSSRTLEVKVVTRNGNKYLNISMASTPSTPNKKSAVLGKAICGYAVCGTN